MLREYSLHNAALEADSEIDGAPSPINLLTTLLRAKWLILCVFVLVSGAALPLIRWKVLPEYQATALVQVRPVIDTVVYRIAEKEEPYYTQYLNTQVFTILSQRVLHRVLERKDVRQTTWYTASSSSTVADQSPRDVAALNEALSVAPVQNTQLISVTMTALDPEDARVIADGVVDEYMKISEEVLLEGDGELVAILTK